MNHVEMSVLHPVEVSTVVDSMLARELKSTQVSNRLADEPSVTALLRFSNELTSLQLTMVEEKGVKLFWRNSKPVHVGSIYLAKVMDIASLNSLVELGLIYASPGDKQFYPSITTSVPATKSPDVRENLSKDGIPIDGSGTRVAVIDTGVTWLHPTFWRVTSGPLDVLEDGSNYYADIDGDGVIDSNEGPIAVVNQQSPSTIEVSNEYMYIDIADNGEFNVADGDCWLAGVDADHDGIISLPAEQVVVLGEPKVAILYDQYSGNVYVRGVNLTTSAPLISDSHGHGTHVASIIAGGQPGYTNMIGVAPGADIIAIRSPLMSADILDAMSFAAENDADVINMSFSSFLGFLDGTDVEDVAVNAIMQNYGVISSLASGNLAASQKHAHFYVSDGEEESATLSVSSPPDYSFLNILWYSSDDDEQIVLISPNDEVIEFSPFKDITGKSFEIDFDDLKAYAFADTSIRGMNRLIIQVSKSNHKWSNGEWSIGLRNPSGSRVEVNCIVWAGSWSDYNLRFTSKVDIYRTLSSPGTADLGITVASCDDSLSYVSSSSGRGPRIDGIDKPVVAAPGVNIMAALNSLTNLWTVRSGTSMAAPHVAGVLALLRQASSTDSAWDIYSAIVQGAGGFSKHRSVPLPDWGYGPVDALTAVRYVLPLNTSGSSTIKDWAGVPVQFGPAEDAGLPESLDIVEIQTYPTSGTLALAVTLRGVPSFLGNKSLYIYWDSDNNPSTGDDGADMLIIYNQSVSVLQWSGTAYESAAIGVEAHESLSSVLINVDFDCSLPNRFSCSTLNETNHIVDNTDWFTVADTWLPSLQDVEISRSSTEWTVNIISSDIDTSLTNLYYEWAVVNGGLGPLSTESGGYDDGLEIVIDTSTFSTTDAVSLIFNLTSDSHSFYSPPILLAGDFSAQVEIQSANLDSYVVSVGPLISSSITGSITVSGELFIDEVLLALHSSQGYWLNFTLTGSNGTYTIDISAGSISAGEYTVYAVAVDKNGYAVEQEMGVLYIVNDYSRVILISALFAAVIVIIKVYKMRTPP